MENPAAWHPDPLGRHELRYWDGQLWTEHVSNAGVTAVDPLDAAEAGEGAQTEAATVGSDDQAKAATSAPPAPQAAPAAQTAGALDQALATATQQAANRIATSALVVGIIALIFSVIPLVGAVAGFPLGGFAVVAGIIGLLISKKSGQGRGASIAGIVLGGLALAAATVQAFVLGRLAEGFVDIDAIITGVVGIL